MCWLCGGEGTIVTCCDDMCRGLGECIHGDGEAECPECHGGRDCEDCDGNRDGCDGCRGGDIAKVDLVAGGMLDPLADRPWLDFGCGQVCRVCGCTDSRACVTNGVPCHWVEEDLCSACVAMNKGARKRLARAQARARKADTRRAHKRGLWHGRRY